MVPIGLHHRLADIAPQPDLWLWPGRIPAGAVSLLVGDPGRGKSLIALDMAARVTTGRPWPGDYPGAPPRDPGDVLLLSAEDSLSRIAHARLQALGADLRRVYVLNAGLWRDSPISRVSHHPDKIWAPTTFGYIPRHAFYSLKHDGHALKSALEALPDCRLVIIDPITAYLNVTTTAKLEEARQHVMPLVTLADASGAAIVAIAHRDAVHDSTGDQR
jgi:putative DNA primase/helicase